MKYITSLLACILASCTVVHTNSPTMGHATYASLGGDSTGVIVTPNGSTIESNDNSKGLATVATAATAIYSIRSWTGLERTKTTQGGETARAGISADTTQALSGNQTAAAINQSNNNAAVAIEAIRNPIPPIEP